MGNIRLQTQEDWYSFLLTLYKKIIIIFYALLFYKVKVK